MQMSFFDQILPNEEIRKQLIQDQELSAKCILMAAKSKGDSTKQFLYSVGNFGFLTGQLTEKQRLAATSTIRSIAMAG
jgi:hypothetical protein